jgi:hypothetical protein
MLGCAAVLDARGFEYTGETEGSKISDDFGHEERVLEFGCT